MSSSGQGREEVVIDASVNLVRQGGEQVFVLYILAGTQGVSVAPDGSPGSPVRGVIPFESFHLVVHIPGFVVFQFRAQGEGIAFRSGAHMDLVRRLLRGKSAYGSNGRGVNIPMPFVGSGAVINMQVVVVGVRDGNITGLIPNGRPVSVRATDDDHSVVPAMVSRHRTGEHFFVA